MYSYDSKIITLSDMLVYFEVLPQAGSNDATVGTSFSQLLESIPHFLPNVVARTILAVSSILSVT